ncbi:MAG: hypothetical protein HY903_18905 [Deltaproteobacteria bacterium]|nr:hypothetical protein [Deltaproteobacteria bacterium]
MRAVVSAVTVALVVGVGLVPDRARAVDISFRNFSTAAAIGPPADGFAVKLADLSTLALGSAGAVRLAKYSPTPPIPKQFKDIVAAVAAGGPLAGGSGFDAAYVSGSDLNPVWGFIYNSGVPFGPTFDEFVGFLYGKATPGGQSGLELLQGIIDRSGANVIALPIVASSQQGSGYFKLPIGGAGATPGIGLVGLCQQQWTLRYLPPAQQVLDRACDNLVARGQIAKKSLKFIQALAGGGSLVKAVADGQIQGFEFATPLDDYSQLFELPEGNPGTVGTRYLHGPGWHQPFLITYLIINKQVWSKLSRAQQMLAMSVSRDHVLSSYAGNLAQQGLRLRQILSANRDDENKAGRLILVEWPATDLALLRDATIQFLNGRAVDASLPEQGRRDYATILEALRVYVSDNNRYWRTRDVPAALRFDGWTSGDAKQGWGSSSP